MATITAVGAWTPLGVDLTGMAKSGPNTSHADMLQLEQLKAQDLPELREFLQAMADGYGIQLQAAKALFHVIWTAAMQRENPTVSRVYAA